MIPALGVTFQNRIIKEHSLLLLRDAVVLRGWLFHQMSIQGLWQGQVALDLNIFRIYGSGELTSQLNSRQV